MKKTVITVILTVFVLLAVFAIVDGVLAGDCPHGWKACYTAKQRSTGNVKCFKATSNNTDPGQGWDKLYEGCVEHVEVVPTLTNLPQIFPTLTPTVIVYTTDTPESIILIIGSSTPTNTYSGPPIATSTPVFGDAIPTTCIECNSRVESCPCLLVTQAFLQANSLATIAAEMTK